MCYRSCNQNINEGTIKSHAGHDVFLSSAFTNFMEQRKRIAALDEARVWAVEKERPDLDTRIGVPPFVIVDTLVEQIRRSKVFICILRDWYGSSVFQNAQSVSFLETEIYEAALYHTNVHFFLLEPFNPDPRLAGLLELVEAVRPGVVPKRTQNEREVLDGIKRVLDDTKNMRRRSWAVSIRRLVGELASRRGYPHPDVEFFDKVFRPVSSMPDKDHIETLLRDVADEPSIEKRLSRMWVALRELSAAPYDDRRFTEFLPMWNDALGAWSSAAAWYGLHGHLYAGRLAAVNSILKIRPRINSTNAVRKPERSIHGSKGGRASEYYSIAKMIPDRAQRSLYLKLALDDVSEAIAAVGGDLSGYLTIRAHIHRAQGQLKDALYDLEEVRRLREAKGDEGSIGEALADLGLVLMESGQVRKGRRLIREGKERLSASGAHTFAIRAQKRLALANLRTGHPFQALDELCEAYDVAQEHQIYGQITALMEAIHELACRLGYWRRKPQ